MVEAAVAAVEFVTARAETQRAEATARLEISLADRPELHAVQDLADVLHRNCRLTLNFHPDRLLEDRTTVAHGLLHRGEYVPQSETQLSNGQRFVPGGERTSWEAQLFGDAYNEHRWRRPVYGALDVTQDPLGGSPRFGSCFVVLADHCFDRATFCVGDSHVGPSDVGTVVSPLSILAGLLEQAAAGQALNRGLDLDDVLAYLRGERVTETSARDLDGYLEAQIHGPMNLERDVSALMVDPSFRDTEVHQQLVECSERYQFPLGWTSGSELRAEPIPPEFRGPSVAELGQRIARDDDVLDAAAIGQSARQISFSPPIAGGDAADSPLQQHKYLWHCLLHLGHDARK